MRLSTQSFITKLGLVYGAGHSHSTLGRAAMPAPGGRLGQGQGLCLAAGSVLALNLSELCRTVQVINPSSVGDTICLD